MEFAAGSYLLRNGMPVLFDVCNGDADGLCSVLQWRLDQPAAATLVTGLKREIELLRLVPDHADQVLVCDLSMKRNHDALVRLLEKGVRVRYFDHHSAGVVPEHVNLEAHLDFSSKVCTSVLMDRHLGGRQRAWAAVGAYGDGMLATAEGLCAAAGIEGEQQAELRRLGEAINYNAYGEDEADVCIHPARLFRIMARYADPLSLIVREPVVAAMGNRRSEDLAKAMALPPHWQSATGRLTLLPDAPWSRRAIGCLANELSGAYPDQAQAVLLRRRSGDLSVSVRAPRSSPTGASQLCEAFGGGGRAAAAGIDALPAGAFARFAAAFSQADWGASPPAADPGSLDMQGRQPC